MQLLNSTTIIRQIKSLSLFAFILISSFSYGQKQYLCKITIEDYPESKILLADFYGDKNSILDTVLTNENGEAAFTFTDDNYTGLYRLYLEKQDMMLDFVFNKEEIIIETEYNFLMDSLKVIKSVENTIYYNFLREDRKYKMKFELLTPVIAYYPKDDDFFDKAASEYQETQKSRNNYIRNLKKKYPDSFAADLAMFQLKPIIPSNLDEREMHQYLLDHFFDEIYFDNPYLLRSDAYPNKILEYLTMYSNSNYSQAQLEDAFIRAIDILFSRPFDNEIVKEYVINYLVKGFETYGFEKVLVHIADTYNEEAACEDEERKSDLQTRLDNFKKLAIGQTAPDFSVPTLDGKTISFSDIETDYVMLIFWATWCPHCTQSIPEIIKMYDNQKEKKIEVIAFSLDTDEEAWRNYITEHKLDWINTSDLKSWDSEIAIDYNIYATPTLIVLDKNRKIISKPLNLYQIEQEFKRE